MRPTGLLCDSERVWVETPPPETSLIASPTSRNHPGKLCSAWLLHRPRPQEETLIFWSNSYEGELAKWREGERARRTIKKTGRDMGLEVKLNWWRREPWSSWVLQTQETWNCLVGSQGPTKTDKIRTLGLGSRVLFLFYLFKLFKKCGPSLLNLLQYCFCIMSWVLGHEVCGILAPRPGIEPTPPPLEGEVLTTGPPGKSQVLFLKALQV